MKVDGVNVKLLRGYYLIIIDDVVVYRTQIKQYAMDCYASCVYELTRGHNDV